MRLEQQAQPGHRLLGLVGLLYWIISLTMGVVAMQGSRPKSLELPHHLHAVTGLDLTLNTSPALETSPAGEPEAPPSLCWPQMRANS